MPGNIVEATEDLMGRHNPSRLLAGSGLYPESLKDLAITGFSEIETASFDVDVSYTHEAWRGRARSHGGIGGSLGSSEVLAFDAALDQMLKEKFASEPLLVPHRVWYATATASARL